MANPKVEWQASNPDVVKVNGKAMSRAEAEALQSTAKGNLKGALSDVLSISGHAR
ncbi:MAG TPA: hypothetical protein VGK54_13715 [Chloroflexota bacterium]|jgi:hypothetical protein